MKFRIFAASSIGPKYSARGWDCQDSSATLEFKNIQAIAVADGHGGGDYFRSAIGSKLAIEVLFNQLKNFFKDDVNEDERLSESGIKKFKYDFVHEWREAVKKDWFERLRGGKPIGEGEIRYKSVSDKYKARYTSNDDKIVERYLYAAYGTTLICAVSTGTQILILQIGDGSCVLLQRNGEFKLPVPREDENFLNVTVSLCDQNSELKIRHAILNCDSNSPNAPVAIFLSTDGLDDCFPYYQNEKHLYQLYADVVIDDMLKSRKNFESVTDKEIKYKLLPELTRKSSQDDISLAYFVINDYLTLKKSFYKINGCYKSEPTPPKISAESETKKFSSTEKTSTQNISLPAQEIYTPPKTSTSLVTATKIDEQPLNIMPNVRAAVENPHSPEPPPFSYATQSSKIFRGTYNAPPVQIDSSLKKTLEGGISN